MKKASSMAPRQTPETIPADIRAALQAAAELPDDQIDTSDPNVPEVLDWSHAIRGRFYRPRKKLVSVRYDEDVLAFFEATGPGYQTRMNRVLRASMLRSLRRHRDTTKQDTAKQRTSS
jgi:uncharacterized protein (DUF4415 family)